MRLAATFTAGVLAGALLALLLTQPSTGRQSSAPRPPAITRDLPLGPVASLGTGVPQSERTASPSSDLDRLGVGGTPLPSLPTGTGPAATEAASDPVPSEAAPNPTPQRTTRPPERLRGVATWYPAGGPVAAAGPALRAALGSSWRGMVISVCGKQSCTRVRLIDWCACGDRHGEPTLLDLGLDAFTRLADPSAGVIDVTVRW